MLDQDENMMADLSTYGWLVGFARNIILEEKKALAKLRGRMGGSA